MTLRITVLSEDSTYEVDVADNATVADVLDATDHGMDDPPPVVVQHDDHPSVTTVMRWALAVAINPGMFPLADDVTTADAVSVHGSTMHLIAVPVAPQPE